MEYSIYSLNLMELQRLNDEELRKVLLGCVKSYRDHSEPTKEIFECPICFEECCVDKCFTNSCGHKFCIECWIQNIDEQIRTDWHQVHCMEQGCNTIVKIEDVLHYKLIPNIAERNMYTERLAFKTFEDVICNCPKCKAQMISVSNSFLVGCPKCEYSFCRKCHEPWHNGRTCEQWKQFLIDTKRMAEEDDKWVEQNTKKCPGCGNRIQKNGGCNHMTCKCGYEFCWLCGAKYFPDHFRYNSTGCKQFT